ncbi:MAG: FAD-dependent oxidoreductase [Gammaproteobacteria bacterium]|nr:MAG: FAD-dependent oxidoreductase [Gammaproteobacteria bacterium]
MQSKPNTLIIGGGWSGLAAAVTLTQQGHAVHLIESAKQLGGRARNIQWKDQTVDNGQHLMIGAYDRMLAMMNTIGSDPDKIFERSPLDITLYDTDYLPLSLSANSRLPWPLSLVWSLIDSAGIGGLYQLTKLQHSIPKILSAEDISVSEWLLNTKQSPRFIKQLWEPLCLATLNTPIELASAQLMARVLKDSLGRGKAAADSLIPRIPLGDVFPRAAAHYIEQHGGKISLNTRARSLIIDNNEVCGVKTKDSRIESNNIIVALSPSQSSKLLADLIPATSTIEYPICTVYLHYPPETRLIKPMIGLTGTISQWVFDRSEQTPGLMAVVISAPGKHEEMTNLELIQHVCAELHDFFPDMPKTVNDSLVVREKRATFACHVNIKQNRPQSKTHIKGLWLAGDYVENGYPASLEGAIRNGENCALNLIKTMYN